MPHNVPLIMRGCISRIKEPNRRKWSLHRLAQLRETVLDSRGGFGEAMAADWGLAGDARTEFLNRSDRRHGVLRPHLHFFLPLLSAALRASPCNAPPKPLPRVHYLVENAGVICTREDIQRSPWGSLVRIEACHLPSRRGSLWAEVFFVNDTPMVDSNPFDHTRSPDPVRSVRGLHSVFSQSSGAFRGQRPGSSKHAARPNAWDSPGCRLRAAVCRIMRWSRACSLCSVAKKCGYILTRGQGGRPGSRRPRSRLATRWKFQAFISREGCVAGRRLIGFVCTHARQRR
jgi:hypothetical protein